jgi:hypothetical protein
MAVSLLWIQGALLRLDHLNPRRKTKVVTNDILDVGICSRFGIVHHVHIMPHGGVIDQSQQLSADQFVSVFPFLMSARSWIEAMNYIDLARRGV